MEPDHGGIQFVFIFMLLLACFLACFFFFRRDKFERREKLMKDKFNQKKKTRASGDGKKK